MRGDLIEVFIIFLGFGNTYREDYFTEIEYSNKTKYVQDNWSNIIDK